jgi:hypothetical protein
MQVDLCLPTTSSVAAHHANSQNTTSAAAQGQDSFAAASPAATIHTLVNAVRVVTEQQRGSSSGQHRRHGKQETMAACAPYAAEIFKAMPEPPYYIPTSAATGLGRDTLLSYVQAVRKLFRMPPVFR